MLGKLIKWDLAADWKKYSVLYAATLLVSVMLVATGKIKEHIINNRMLEIIEVMFGTLFNCNCCSRLYRDPILQKRYSGRGISNPYASRSHMADTGIKAYRILYLVRIGGNSRRGVSGYSYGRAVMAV